MGTEMIDVIKQIQGLRIDQEQEINILLLGTTGIGKSTFINALANYLSYKSLKQAEKEQLMVLIPSHVSLPEKKAEFDVGNQDKNEYLEVGASATQDVKSYVFPIGEGKTKLRIIDTPGIGDTKGLNQDKINCENILSYLTQLDSLHAICCLFSTSSSRINAYFEYCFKEIMSRLDKTASDNLIFIFTNTRGAHYSPGDTLGVLRRMVENIENHPPHVKIPLQKNVFCFENDSFKYLAARKKDIVFEDKERSAYKESWRISSQSCWGLVKYIAGDDQNPPLKPHDIKNTVSINEARRLIVHLSQPLADITEMIQDNIHVLDRHRRNLNLQDVSVSELKKKLYVPVINLKVVELQRPVTVCSASKCVEHYQVGEKQKVHYITRCHNPCYLRNVPKDKIGASELIHCAAMCGTNTCQMCRCDFSAHMHIYYETTTVQENMEDKVIKNNIHSKEEALKHTRQIIKDVEVRKKEYEQESKQIVKYVAQFAHFLKSNAITPFNDSYQKYIQYLIEREQCLGDLADPENVKQLNRLLDEYKEAKKSFDEALKHNYSGTTAITPEVIFSSISSMYQLRHTGDKIREMVSSQKTARNSEYDNTCEYVHESSGNMFIKLSRKIQDVKQKTKKKNQDSKDITKTKTDHKSNNTSDTQQNRPYRNQFRSRGNTRGYRSDSGYVHSNSRPTGQGYAYHTQGRSAEYDSAVLGYNASFRPPDHPPPYTQVHVVYNSDPACGNRGCSDPSCFNVPSYPSNCTSSSYPYSGAAQAQQSQCYGECCRPQQPYTGHGAYQQQPGGYSHHSGYQTPQQSYRSHTGYQQNNYGHNANRGQSNFRGNNNRRGQPSDGRINRRQYRKHNNKSETASESANNSDSD